MLLAMASPIEHVTTLISEANFSTKQAPLNFLNKDNQVKKGIKLIETIEKYNLQK